MTGNSELTAEMIPTSALPTNWKLTGQKSVLGSQRFKLPRMPFLDREVDLLPPGLWCDLYFRVADQSSDTLAHRFTGHVVWSPAHPGLAERPNLGIVTCVQDI